MSNELELFIRVMWLIFTVSIGALIGVWIGSLIVFPASLLVIVVVCLGWGLLSTQILNHILLGK